MTVQPASGPKVHIELSLPDQIFTRVYYVLCSATDLLQTIAKLAVAIFSSLFAGLCFGQSTVFNQVTVYFLKDTLFSTEMFFQSVRGILDPVGAYSAKGSLHYNNVLDFHAQDINFVENCTSRLIFAANMIKEFVMSLLAALRFATALALTTLSLGTAPGTCVLAVGSCVSMSRAITMTWVSFVGILAPASILSEMRSARIS